jgi:hypothetical protein
VQAESKQRSGASKRLVDTNAYIRDLMTAHHKLMADVAVLLRCKQMIQIFKNLVLLRLPYLKSTFLNFTYLFSQLEPLKKKKIFVPYFFEIFG